MIKKNKIFILLMILFLYFLIKVNFLRNLYEVIFLNHEERISKVYGFCENEGVGYVNFIKNKFDIKEKIILINAKKNPHQWPDYNTKFKEVDSAKHFIIINYKKVKNKIDFKNYKILNKINDCYYVIKND